MSDPADIRRQFVVMLPPERRADFGQRLAVAIDAYRTFRDSVVRCCERPDDDSIILAAVDAAKQAEQAIEALPAAVWRPIRPEVRSLFCFQTAELTAERLIDNLRHERRRGRLDRVAENVQEFSAYLLELLGEWSALLPSREPDGPQPDGTFRIGDQVFDELTTTELCLFECLWNEGKFGHVPWPVVMKAMYQDGNYPEQASAEKHVTRLRKKLAEQSTFAWKIMGRNHGLTLQRVEEGKTGQRCL